MPRSYRFKPNQQTPIVTAKLTGTSRRRAVRLVFDTGAATTQFHTPVLDGLGFSAATGISPTAAYGPAGPTQEGYLLQIKNLEVFGVAFNDLIVAAYDFDHLADSGIDGLLGFDLIQQFHLEMDGPNGVLNFFKLHPLN